MLLICVYFRILFRLPKYVQHCLKVDPFVLLWLVGPCSLTHLDNGKFQTLKQSCCLYCKWRSNCSKLRYVNRFKITNCTAHTTIDYGLCVLPSHQFFHHAVWELGAAVWCIARIKTEVWCPCYSVLVSHSELIAVHHRGFLNSTALLQATSLCPVCSSVIKGSQSC